MKQTKKNPQEHFRAVPLRWSELVYIVGKMLILPKKIDTVPANNCKPVFFFPEHFKFKFIAHALWCLFSELAIVCIDSLLHGQSIGHEVIENIWTYRTPAGPEGIRNLETYDHLSAIFLICTVHVGMMRRIIFPLPANIVHGNLQILFFCWF